MSRRGKTLASLRGVTCWHRAKPRMVTFGSTVGDLILTEEALIFLSTGSMDLSAGVATEMMYVDSEGPGDPGGVGEALKRKQSVVIPLERLESIGLRKRLLGLSNWLGVSYRDESGQVRHLAAVHASKLPQGFVEEVEKAKAKKGGKI